MRQRRTIRLSHRDRQILSDLDHGDHATRHLADLYFNGNRKKASERLTALHDHGLVKRFPNPQLDQTGRPEYVYRTKNRRIPRNHAGLAHSLAVTDYRVRLNAWCKNTPGISGAFYCPTQLPQRLTGGLIPDATYMLTRGGTALLYFLEVDRGTEALRGTGYSLADKLRRYADYLDTGQYATDFDWLSTFNGFRVTLTVPTTTRLRTIQRLLQNEGHDFALLITNQRLLTATSLADFSWTTHTGDAANLLGHTQPRRGKSQGKTRANTPHRGNT